ncbi:MAG: hypothetical protein CVV44_13425 [Spirochaetae bacterium HGW-Spirochaetae-1]|jgi:pimeloyl-ACP methyl ester carboxylesterase|nr:MAG: hypothetical protein CVV44_13425 [Spirochaetae bacterium HGW-Spirochaetae-1]
MTIEIRTCIQNGCSVSYRTNAGRDTRALFFVHGLGADSRFYYKQLKYFSQYYRVIAIDLPGHGLSPCDHVPTLEDYSRALTGVIEMEEIESLVLIGHSMGGSICLDLFSRRTVPIDAMVLISTGASLSMVESFLDVSKNDFMTFYNNLLKQVFSKKGGLMTRMADKCATALNREVFSNNLAICRGIDHSGILHTVDIPVLVMGNKNDTLVPIETSAALARGIRDAEFAEFDSEGHIPFFENPDMFNDILLKFLNERFKMASISPEVSEILDK